MSKAEERALEAYPIHPTLPNEVKDYIAAEQQAYHKGYEQAEKDLALTWEDAQLLYIITEKYMREIDNRIEKAPSSSQEVFEEIIRRYKKAKK